MLEEVVVWVPVGRLATLIRPGSGVVSSAPERGGRILVDFEGAVYGQASMKVYADRVCHAWGRQTANFPTVARAWPRVDELVRLGTFDPIEGVVELDDVCALGSSRDVLAEWLKVQEVPDSQLLATGRNYEIRRHLQTMLHSGDPQKVTAARWWAKHERIPLPL